ncbi:hypothetical protein EBT16_06220 [bacterium]|nr:hypothetical protein [bacterium]
MAILFRYEKPNSPDETLLSTASTYLVSSPGLSLTYGDTLDFKRLESLPLELGMRGYHEAWVEVGPTLFSAFMREQIFQEVVLYQSSSIEIIHGKEAFLGARDSVFQGYRKVAQEKMGTDLRESWFLK